MAVPEIPPLPLESSKKRAWRWAIAGMFVVRVLFGRVRVRCLVWRREFWSYA
jgi:hypothetical protein